MPDPVLTFDSALATLDDALRRPLPGAAVQDLLAPRPRREWPDGFNPARIRHAAGLLLVYPVENRPHIVLTVRSDSLGRHGGQVSLPGGVVDAGETFERTALREAHEEIALDPRLVRTLGALTPLDIPVSGFRLHPVVGAAAARPLLRPADAEVARILEVNVADLLAAGVTSAREVAREGAALLVPAFQTHGVAIWGATAMVLAEFLALFGWRGPDPW